jgi:DNA (cytosine-5)-methyltransferase 1
VPVTSVSVFTGAGGLDYGLEAAGIATAVAIEADPDCCATLTQSREWPLIPRDVRSVAGSEVLAAGAIPPGMVDIIVAGPPCQPFSMSANWANGRPKGLADPRSKTLTEMLRLVEELCPTLLVVENVPGFASNGGLAYLRTRLADINHRKGTSYALASEILNAADWGVPQLRRRLLAVADREGRLFCFPKPTHGEEASRPWTTAWDAIGEIPRDSSAGESLHVRGRWADLLPTIPEGQNYLWHTDRGGGCSLFGWRTRYWSFLLKLAKARPSWTISAAPSQNAGPFHWDNRLLSTEELRRLQTLPSDVIFAGTQSSRQRQIGNAVPSLMAEVLGRAIRKHLSPSVSFRTEPRLAVRSLGRCPPARAPVDLPEQYAHLVGVHTPHPGAGRGPRAIQLTATARSKAPQEGGA